MKINRALLVFLAIICACNNNHVNSDHNLVELDPFKKSLSPYMTDSIVSEFSVLKLLTPKGVLIGRIEKIKFSKNRIYISDGSVMNSVYIFDLFGNYINHLEGGFKGPGEFIRPKSITVDFQNDDLYVFDDKTGKIIHYNSEGDFLDETKFRYTACDIAKIDGVGFAFNAGYSLIDNKVNSYDLVFGSSSGKVKSKFLPLKKWRKGTYYNKQNTFLEYENFTWYSPVYNDTVYRLFKEGPAAVFKFNMGDKFVDDKLASAIDVEDKTMDYTPAISNFAIAGNCVYMDFRVVDEKTGNRVSKLSFFDLNSRNLYSCDFYISTGITSGLFKPPLTSTGEYFVSSIDAFDAKQALEWKIENGADLSEERMELYLNLSESDNPLLMFYKVAPF